MYEMRFSNKTGLFKKAPVAYNLFLSHVSNEFLGNRISFLKSRVIFLFFLISNCVVLPTTQVLLGFRFWLRYVQFLFFAFLDTYHARPMHNFLSVILSMINEHPYFRFSPRLTFSSRQDDVADDLFHALNRNAGNRECKALR